MGPVSPFVVIGLMLSALAALAAFLITYEEWSHHYASKREPLKFAIEAAIVAFLVFAILTVLVNVFVSRFMQQ
jgi:predicted membrane protein